MINVTNGTVTFKNPTKKEHSDFMLFLVGDTTTTNQEHSNKHLMECKDRAFKMLCDKIEIDGQEYTYEDIEKTLEPQGKWLISDWLKCEAESMKVLNGVNEETKKK